MDLNVCLLIDSKEGPYYHTNCDSQEHLFNYNAYGFAELRKGEFCETKDTILCKAKQFDSLKNRFQIFNVGDYNILFG